jgi:hypothetical protein
MKVCHYLYGFSHLGTLAVFSSVAHPGTAASMICSKVIGPLRLPSQYLLSGALGVSEEGERAMKLSAPKQITFWVAVVVALIGLLGALLKLSVLETWGIWVLALGFVILAVGNLMEGM